MGPAALAQVLRPLAGLFPEDLSTGLVVGVDGFDDAAVYRLHDDEVLIATVDFFPPIVDDPFDFGRIAAANAMSDVFAMGGEVLLALNLLCWPDSLPYSVAARVIEGGATKVLEAGAVVGGGHSIVDAEPKYGLAVIGRAHPDAVLRLSGAQPGNVLLLTKPLGTGVVTTALKEGSAEASDVAAAVESMAALNGPAARALVRAGATAATDVTGYSFAGHALEMSEHSGVGLRVEAARLPLLPGAIRYSEQGFVPGGSVRNRAAYKGRVSGLDRLDDALAHIIFDAQTSGGLLAALPVEAGPAVLDELDELGIDGRVVGEVIDGEGLHLC